MHIHNISINRSQINLKISCVVYYTLVCVYCNRVSIWYTMVIFQNSTSILSSFITCLGPITFNLTLFILCSLSFTCIRPILSLAPYTGTFIFFNIYGRAPIWSSCPCVINIPFILSLFLLNKLYLV